MTLDWEYIQKVETKELTDAQAEVLYDQLIQYNINGSETTEQLKKLFECSKLVMQVKAIQADVAIEELEEIISRENANQKNLKSNLEDQNDSISERNEQQLLESERANELLRTQLKEKDVELNRLEQIKSNLEQTLKLNERQLANYNQEIEQLREELHIEKEQINEQLADNYLPFEQLRDMNKKFYMLLEEMKDMETMNTQLGEKVMKLNEELNLATKQIQTATKEMQYMKNNLNRLQEMNDILINEKEESLNEIKRLKKLTSNYESESDEYLGSNFKKIQELTERLKLKEDELNDLKRQLESIDKKQIEEEKAYFLKEISKRDNHIKLLRNQLSQAIDDIEAQTSVIENLIEKNIENLHKSENLDTDKNVTNSQVLNSNQLISKLEEELRSKDKEMTILHQRNTLYEKGIYGLSEAVEEINKLTKLIKSKDNEIDKLVKELNSINLKLSNTQDELDYLKEFMNADEDLKKKLNEESEVKNDKLKILKLQKEVIRLDAEKLKLYEEVLSYKLSLKKRDSPISTLTTDQMIEGKPSSLNDNLEGIKQLQDIKQLQKLNSIQEMENENRELQLAMKEILIGLKESDSKSDVIIDCPSLERLCQFFESRSINTNLANVIALKAELDILRGHNDELRMTNKRLRNDIFKIFENYSKHLLTDFVIKHQSEHSDLMEEVKDDKKPINYVNQTLTEDKLYDSDLSEGEIVLNSRSLSIKKSVQEKQAQTDLDFEAMNRIEFNKERKSDDLDDNFNGNFKVNTYSTSDSSSNNDLNNENQLDKNHSFTDLDEKENQLNKNQLIFDLNQQDKTELEDQLLQEDSNMDKLNNLPMNKKVFDEKITQTELSLNELKNLEWIKEIENLQEIFKFKNVNELKDLIDKRSSINQQSTKPKEILMKDATSQTVTELSNVQETSLPETKVCSQCNLVQNLLIEFQNKIDRIDSSIIQREDLYTDRINVLQEENNRLQTEIQKIVQIKDDLLNQKDKQIIELNDKIIGQKEEIINLKESLNKTNESNKIELVKKEASNGSQETEIKEKKSDFKDQNNEIKDLEKQNIDNQIAILSEGAINSNNQRGLVNILETIIKCLQARIEHKDEAIKHYQQLLTKTQEEHQEEISRLMKNYKKVTKAIQSSSNVNQEHLETTLTKYNDQLNEFKTYHQKVLAEQKKAFELQHCKLKRLKIENERLKIETSTTEELNRLRSENEQLNKLVEKNVKFIEKLKNSIKEERIFKQDLKLEKPEEPSKLMQLNKLKEETENLYKLLISKDKQIKELQLSKWNLEKRMNEITQLHNAKLKEKTIELDKVMNDQIKLKNLLEKMEKEKNAIKRRQAIVIKEPLIKDHLVTKEIQTDKIVNFSNSNQESLFIEKFKQLDQIILTLKSQLQNCAQREKELIDLLEMKELKTSRREQVTSKEFSIKSLKGKKFDIGKKNSCDF